MSTTPNSELVVRAVARSHQLDELLYLRSSGRSVDTAGAQLAFRIAVVGCDGRIVRCASRVGDASWNVGVDELAAILRRRSKHCGWQRCYKQIQNRSIHGSAWTDVLGGISVRTLFESSPICKRRSENERDYRELNQAILRRRDALPLDNSTIHLDKLNESR